MLDLRGRAMNAYEDAVVKADHLSMHFNMASEKVDSIRDYLTKLTSRKLFYNDFIAVKDVSFEVGKGEVFGIIGANGSGKSTLLKMIAGVLKPTSGTVITRGTVAPLIELGAGFDIQLTGKENIFLNGAIMGYSQEFMEEQYQSIVDFSEIRDFLDMPLKNYSSGMVARIAFAIATSVEPDILLADEILSVGDYRFQEKCEKRIKDLMQRGTTVLLVSHSFETVEQLCSRALWINKGNQMLVGDTSEVVAAYRSYTE